MYFESYWPDAAFNKRNVEWLRALYQELYANTAAFPVPNGVTDGCYVNYPDTDLGDPAYNSSGVSFHELYHKDNYPGCSG
ncbi:putative protein chryRM OS=Streptomyces albaduncus OX=68172 GN=chryRM PE=3 SV=1 [Streptomyces griseoloalbus]